MIYFFYKLKSSNSVSILYDNVDRLTIVLYENRIKCSCFSIPTCYSCAMDFAISSRINNREAIFTLNWSALTKADRWAIAKGVPAMGGVFELYWMDDHKRLRLLHIGNANMGGLRSEIRRLSDAELCDNSRIHAILETFDIYYRFSICDSARDMADIVWYFRKRYFPEDPGVDHSGRFDVITVMENAPDRVHWVD